MISASLLGRVNTLFVLCSSILILRILVADKLHVKILLFLCFCEIVSPEMKTEILRRSQDALIIFKRALKNTCWVDFEAPV